MRIHNLHIGTSQRLPIIDLLIGTGYHCKTKRIDGHFIEFIGYVIVLGFSFAEDSFRYDCVGAHVCTTICIQAERCAASECELTKYSHYSIVAVINMIDCPFPDIITILIIAFNPLRYVPESLVFH